MAGEVVASLLLSLVAAWLASLSLAEHFHTGAGVFNLILAFLFGFAGVATAVFALARVWAGRARIIDLAAVGLALLAGAIVSVPQLIQWIADRSTNPFTVGIENTHIAIQLLVPALLIVLVQWGLARRFWRRARGDSLSGWPWVTTVIGALVILSPIGLDILRSAQPSRSNFMWELAAMIALGVGAVLLVMAAVEWYIRARILRRRALGAPSARSWLLERR